MNGNKNREYEKKIVKLLAAATIIALETAIYGYVWNEYLNSTLEFPFWRRGNWLIVALYAILLLFFNQMYGGLKVGFLRRGNLIYSQILSVTFVNIITFIQIALIDKQFSSFPYIAAIECADVIVIVFWCFIFQHIYFGAFPPRRMLLVYAKQPDMNLMGKINSRDDKYILAGTINMSQGMKRVMKTAEKYDAVILGDIPAERRNDLLKACYRRNIRTYTLPKISDIIIRSAVELNIFDSPLYLSRNEGLSIQQEIVKRVSDIAISAAALIVTSPLFLLIAIAIKLEDGGTVLYKQTRLTKDRKSFEIYKFRTMTQDAEKLSGAVLAAEHDARVTRVGRLLRVCRMDELPQFINILKGEMSVVGPRPERPEIAERIEKEIPEFALRLKVKAGLTGYAQFYGKYNTTPYDKLKLDLTYILNYSFLLDLKLMILTPKILLLKESTEGIKPEDGGDHDDTIAGNV